MRDWSTKASLDNCIKDLTKKYKQFKKSEDEFNSAFNVLGFNEVSKPIKNIPAISKPTQKAITALMRNANKSRSGWCLYYNPNYDTFYISNYIGDENLAHKSEGLQKIKASDMRFLCNNYIIRLHKKYFDTM